MTTAVSHLFTLLGVAFLGLLVWAALSPFETLGWWAGWFGDKIYDDDVPSDGLVRSILPAPHSYILFLSGIGRTSGYTLSYREGEFLRRLAKVLPHTVIIDDIFPYSVNNLALTGQPFFARIWRWSLDRKMRGSKGSVLAGNLINIRNALQVFTSADHRYGPIYNQATAEVFLHSLLRYDYDVDGDAPIFIIGYSGSAQLGVGAVTYLKEWVKAPVYLISLGGIFGSDPGLLAVDHLFHLQGTSDRAVKLSYIAPGRWHFMATSEFNRARRQGKITKRMIGPMGHTGRGGYLDAKTLMHDGTPYAHRTVDEVCRIVNEVVFTPDDRNSRLSEQRA